MKSFTYIISVFLIVSLGFGDVLAARKLPPTTEESCIKRDIRAKEIKTGSIETFASSCAVPEGWIEMGRSGYSENISVTKEEKETSLMKLSIPESTDDRKIFIVTKDYAISEANATLVASVNILKQKSYSIVGIDSKKSGDVYLNLKKNREGHKIFLYIRYKNEDAKKYSIIKFDLSQGNSFQNDKNALGNYGIVVVD